MPDWGPPVAAIYPTGPSVLTIGAPSRIRLRRCGPSVQPILWCILRCFSNCCVIARGAHGISRVAWPSGRSSTLREALAFANLQALPGRSLAWSRWDIYSAADGPVSLSPAPRRGAITFRPSPCSRGALNETGARLRPRRNRPSGLSRRCTILLRHLFATRSAISVEVDEQCPCARTLPVLARILDGPATCLSCPPEKRYSYW